MTCIVALRDDDGHIWMGGDSLALAGWNKSILPDGKVFKHGEFLLGFSGILRGGSLLRYAFKPPAIDVVDTATGESHAPDLAEYMNTIFVDSLRECFKNGGFAQKTDEKEKSEVLCLVGVRGHVFLVECNYCASEDQRPYVATGCGQDFALGSLATSEKLDANLTPKERVTMAIEAAIEHSAGVGGPITVRSDYD